MACSSSTMNRRRPYFVGVATLLMMLSLSDPTGLRNGNTFSTVKAYNLLRPTSHHHHVKSSMTENNPPQSTVNIAATVVSTKTQLPMISHCDEECALESFELHVGRALDVLRSDYPDLLTKNPDYSIYDPDIIFTDPSGVSLHGIRKYKGAFSLLHTIIQLIYCPARSSINLRMCYDKARQNIRVSWNVEVVPREIFGGTRTTGHVDGISVYELDKESGNITQHRIERLLFNDRPFVPEEGVIAHLRKEHSVTVPSFSKYESNHDHINNGLVNFLSNSNPSNPKSTLFALEAAGGDPENHPDFDWDAYESKNRSRQKFGLKALTPEEFVEIESQIQHLDSQQRVIAEIAAAEQAKATIQQQQQQQQQKDAKQNSFLDKVLGSVLPKDTCESNFDCERPELCCDFGFVKRCCGSGSLIYSGMQLQPILVPVPINNNNYPPQPY